MVNNNINLDCVNKVIICGKIVQEAYYEWPGYGEGIFRTKVRVKRMDGKYDIIPVVVPEYIFRSNLSRGNYFKILGKCRTVNVISQNKYNAKITIYASQIDSIIGTEALSTNKIILKGYLYKKALLKSIHKSNQVSNILLAVKYSQGNADYIPCIFRNGITSRIANHNIGQIISIYGHIHSHLSSAKRCNDIRDETVCEVSVRSILC
jgi:hypothetical protein